MTGYEVAIIINSVTLIVVAAALHVHDRRHKVERERSTTHHMVICSSCGSFMMDDMQDRHYQSLHPELMSGFETYSLG